MAKLHLQSPESGGVVGRLSTMSPLEMDVIRPFGMSTHTFGLRPKKNEKKPKVKIQTLEKTSKLSTL